MKCQIYQEKNEHNIKIKKTHVLKHEFFLWLIFYVIFHKGNH